MARLHDRLQQDTFPVTDTPLCWVRWMNDRRFPWLVVVPKYDAVREWHHLPAEEQQQLLLLVNRLAAQLEQFTQADKINIGALGNQVPQLHIHIIARFESDPCWPGPVWGQGQAQPWADGEKPVWLDSLSVTGEA